MLEMCFGEVRNIAELKNLQYKNKMLQIVYKIYFFQIVLFLYCARGMPVKR